MPKTPSIILKEELSKKQIELLDIYRFKDHDLIRVRNKLTNKVYLIKVEGHVSDIVTKEGLQNVIEKIISFIKIQKT